MQVDYIGICLYRYLRHLQQSILAFTLHPPASGFRDTVVIFQITWFDTPCPDGGHRLGRMNRVVMVQSVVLRDKLGSKLAPKGVLLFLASFVWSRRD